jgi:glutamate dehydrogenase
VLHIHAVEVRGGGTIDLGAEVDGDRLSSAMMAVWNGQAAADSLNRLVLLAEMDWHDVTVLRAYRRYRRQVGTSFTEEYQNEALCQHPDVARALVDLFAARFSPDPPASEPPGAESPGAASTVGRRNPEAAADEARRRVLDGLDEVTRLDQDRILRGYLGLVDATLRTNHYLRPRRHWLSLKLDSASVPEIPKPVPYREIFVYATDMEGIHLRGGAIARGGLRWSDRLEDVRTEVLGLMKAQVTKNSMIVPTGSKGGFVLKHPPAEPGGLRRDVRKQYEVFIRGLLDLTDNVVDDKVVPLERVVRADDDDPYLVVAADRGTATFSDLANSVSEEYGYWLKDAFASGGSRGYDHKEMGITARGTWEAVRRHFSELDVDVQEEPITITGIGDMSGDVFGNGLLRSHAVKLVAAFDHRDIFVDPEPDTEASFAERQRLYDKPRSTWQDYDRDVISPGGGVWPRSVKSIALSDEMRELLRVDDERLSPPELIRAMLQAPADLLFAGGVGTFVKSSKESNDDVGDRTNDAIRVNAANVGARVIGEGGNLAVTQRGRIAFARRGGRVNLDAIDNAAGVATSDAEVNLKILLQLAMDRGELDEQERDQALNDVRSDVAASVLHSVWRQAWAISREVAGSPGGMEAYEQLLTDLEDSGRADRRVDVLPTTEEMQRRREAGAGLTRPELGMLLGASKRDLIARLLDSDVPDDPALRPLLVGAFPAAVSQRFDHLLDDHRLRRELIATRLAGEIVDRMGITYVSRTAHERGCMAAEVASGYWVARQVIDASDHWAAIDELEGTVVPALQLDLTAEVDSLMDACTRAYLREMPVGSMSDLIEVDRAAVVGLCDYVQELGGTHAALRAGRIGRWTDVGVEQDLAERIAMLAELTLAPDVAAVAQRLERSVHAVADAFISVTHRLPLEALHDRLQKVTPVGNWERWQTRALVDELRDLRRQIATAALAHHPRADAEGGEGGEGGEEAVDGYLAERETVTERVSSLMERLESDAEAGLAAVTVVVTALREIID